MNQKKVPKRLQSVLWSVDVRHLDIDRDRGYIIHQILSRGRMEDILWLLKTYLKKELRTVFITIPYKDYDASRFYFIKDYLLNLSATKLNKKYYVKNIPRDIR